MITNLVRPACPTAPARRSSPPTPSRPRSAALEGGSQVLRRLSHQNDAWLKDVQPRDDRGVHGDEQGRHRGARPDREAGRVSGGPEVSDAAAHPRRAERPGRARVQLRARALRRQRLRRRRGRTIAAATAAAAPTRRRSSRTGAARKSIDLLGAMDHVQTLPARRRRRAWASAAGATAGSSPTTRSRPTAASRRRRSGAGSALQLSMYGVDQYITQYENEIGPPWKITGPVDQDLVSVLPRGPDQDADAVPRAARRTSTSRWSAASRCTRR